MLVHSGPFLQQLLEATQRLTEHLAAAAAQPLQQAEPQPPGRASLSELLPLAAEQAQSREDARPGAPPEACAEAGQLPACAELPCEPPPAPLQPPLCANLVSGAAPRAETPGAARASVSCRAPPPAALAEQAAGRRTVRATRRKHMELSQQCVPASHGEQPAGTGT